MLIAGDAAHLMPVWQGQGYNSGVRDATNLAWKLTAVLRGIADDALLDTYDTERRDHAKAMIDVSVAMGRILSPTNKAVAGARDKIAAALNLVPAAKRWIAEGRYKPKPRFHVGALVDAVGPAAQRQPVGQMFPQPRVDTRTEQNVLLDDVLGPWFSVLVWGNDPRHVFDRQLPGHADPARREADQHPAVHPAALGRRTDRRPAGGRRRHRDRRRHRPAEVLVRHPPGRLRDRPARPVRRRRRDRPARLIRHDLTRHRPAPHHPETTMTLALCSMSHSPLLELSQPPAELAADVETAFAAARKFINEYDPELVVVFGPDHYNGFFYELMPQFCIGLAATSIGDFGSTPGPLDVPRDIAEGLAQAALDGGVDLAVSLRMEVDHGMVQPLEILFGGLDTVPTVPFFINSVAPPFTPVHRVRALGEALGRYLSGLDKRVLLIGSGGLSHEPPVPTLETAPPHVVEGLIAGRHPTDGGDREAAGQRHRRREAVRRRRGQPQGAEPGLGQHLPRPAGRERPGRDRRVHQRLDQGTRRAVRAGDPELDRRLRRPVHRRPVRHHLPLLPAHPGIHRRLQRHHRTPTHRRLRVSSLPLSRRGRGRLGSA